MRTDGDIPCGLCGKAGKRVLIPIYVREKDETFFKKKLVCIGCLTELWEEEVGSNENDEDE